MKPDQMQNAIRRIAALLTLVALLFAAASLVSPAPERFPAALSASAPADAVAGLLVPKNVRLIIEYKRTAIA